MKNLKVLCVVREVLPYPGGYSIRGNYIFNELSKYFKTYVIASNYDNTNYYDNYNFTRDSIKYYINKCPAIIVKDKICNLSGSGIILRYLRRIHFYNKLKEYVKKIDPDVIIGHSPLEVALPALQIARKFHKPYIFDVRQFNFVKNQDTLRGLYDKKLIRSIIKHSNGFALISKGTGRILMSFLKKNEIRPITYIPNGIPNSFIDRFESPSISDSSIYDLRRRYKLSRNVIGYIGTISEYEGLDSLIEVFSKCSFKNTSLLIVGEGPYFPEIREKVAALCSKNIVLTGRISHEDIAQYYKLIDLFVLPRKSTPVTESVTPIKPFEIMYARKPLICSSVGGFSEIITDGKNGIVFQAGNKEQLAKCLKTVLKEKERIDNITNRAYEWVCKNYRWETIGRKYMEIVVDVFKKFNGVDSQI